MMSGALYVCSYQMILVAVSAHSPWASSMQQECIVSVLTCSCTTPETRTGTSDSPAKWWKVSSQKLCDVARHRLHLRFHQVLVFWKTYMMLKVLTSDDMLLDWCRSSEIMTDHHWSLYPVSLAFKGSNFLISMSCCTFVQCDGRTFWSIWCSICKSIRGLVYCKLPQTQQIILSEPLCSSSWHMVQQSSNSALIYCSHLWLKAGCNAQPKVRLCWSLY